MYIFLDLPVEFIEGFFSRRSFPENLWQRVEVDLYVGFWGFFFSEPWWQWRRFGRAQFLSSKNENVAYCLPAFM